MQEKVIERRRGLSILAIVTLFLMCGIPTMVFMDRRTGDTNRVLTNIRRVHQFQQFPLRATPPNLTLADLGKLRHRALLGQGRRPLQVLLPMATPLPTTLRPEVPTITLRELNG